MPGDLGQKLLMLVKKTLVDKYPVYKYSVLRTLREFV